MRVQWPNVFVLLLAVFALVLLVSNRFELTSILATVRDIGPGHTPEEQTLGLMTLGLALVSLVAIVRLLTARRNDP